jgi:WD40 repeat protein
LAFASDSKLLVVGSDTTTSVLDADTGHKTTTLPVDKTVRAASADANLLAAWGPDGECVIWDVAAARARSELSIGPNVAGAAFSRDGQTLVAWNEDASGAARVRLWDLNSSRARLALRVEGFGR